MFRDKYGNNLTAVVFLKKIINRFLTILLEFQLYLLHFTGLIPSRSVRKIIYILCGLKINWSSTIYMGADFFRPSGIIIGKDTAIGKNCFLDGRAALSVGDHTDIASDVLIYNDQHNIHDPHFGNQFGEVHIGDYVFVGPRAIILPGVTIGKGAVVAAGAVVTKSIPPYEVWGGIPAKKIADREVKKLNYTIGRTMMFQ